MATHHTTIHVKMDLSNPLKPTMMCNNNTSHTITLYQSMCDNVDDCHMMDGHYCQYVGVCALCNIIYIHDDVVWCIDGDGFHVTMYKLNGDGYY